MPVVAALAAIALIIFVFLDVFETVILPRRVSRRFRITRIIYMLTWSPVRSISNHMRDSGRRESFLAVYGPISLLLLLFAWTISLIFSYGVLFWALGMPMVTPEKHPAFGAALYVSGTTFFTLGLGDITPITPLARLLIVIEGGSGFAMIALVIGYLPILYQSFSRREVNISMLDARAGSPPTAIELLRRHHKEDSNTLSVLLADWEHWSAELLESHLSYPALAYFRSQHEHQSWLAAITMILDSCALIMVGIDGVPKHQAQLTFAMARHAVVDLSQALAAPPREMDGDRHESSDPTRLRALLADIHITLATGHDADKHLIELRHMYEPYVAALADRLLLTLPPWSAPTQVKDDWQTSIWEHDADHRNSAVVSRS